MWFPEDNVWYNRTGERLGLDVEGAESQKIENRLPDRCSCKDSERDCSARHQQDNSLATAHSFPPVLALQAEKLTILIWGVGFGSETRKTVRA